MVELNKYGFYELKNKPSQEELNTYYSEKYYQDGNIATYRASYPEEELTYFYNKIAQKYQYLINQGLIDENKPCKLLDVGCGEGFTLDFFKKKGWDVTGLDFSSFGCQSFNPSCLDNLIVGDVYQNLEKLTNENKTYDIIWLDNVLEHVLNPLELLTKLHRISTQTGVLIIEVPNDFSVVQEHLYKKGMLEKQNWIAIPDHISYFNRDGLAKICETATWNTSDIIADFPIDWFLFNTQSNYYVDRTKGKSAHQARVELENMLHDISMEKTIALYKSLADLGMGRQLIGFFTK